MIVMLCRVPCFWTCELLMVIFQLSTKMNMQLNIIHLIIFFHLYKSFIAFNIVFGFLFANPYIMCVDLNLGLCHISKCYTAKWLPQLSFYHRKIYTYMEHKNIGINLNIPNHFHNIKRSTSISRHKLFLTDWIKRDIFTIFYGVN